MDVIRSGTTPISSTDNRISRYLLVAAVALWISGCAVVKPYEREHLADPIMGIAEGQTKQGLSDKLYSTTEGSAGGEEGLSGGCGCSK